jgi:xanthosine phosphorylase
MQGSKVIQIAPIDVAKKVRQATAIIKAHAGSRQPEIAIICGSGLGDIGQQLEDAIHIPYADIPGFPKCPVAGHQGEVILGRWQGREIMCLLGRAHLYEGGNVSTIRSFVRTIKNLGIKTLLVTSAVGSLRTETPPGHLVLVTDHINFQFTNPLLGANEDAFGPRFIGLEDCYHPELRQQLKHAAQDLNIPLNEGVFVGTIGPSFETPAEIRAFNTLGGDVVGMSVIPEIIVAKHCGLAAAAISVVTNLAAGLSEEALSHEVTLRGAAEGTGRLIQVCELFVKNLKAVSGK